MESVLISQRDAVRVHLDQLERSTVPDAPGADEAIYASVAMRFLMDDNALGGIARENGQTIYVECPDFSAVPLEQVLAFAAGGYPFNAHLMPAYYLYRESGPQSIHRSLFEENLRSSPKHPAIIRLKLNQFLATPCLALMGRTVNRSTLIRYVANRCGGAHYHGSRQAFTDIDNRLTDIGRVIKLGGDGLSTVFLEVLGTAWLLLQSQEVKDLRDALGRRSVMP